MSIESVIPPNHLILCHPLLLSPSIFPSLMGKDPSFPLSWLFTSGGQSFSFTSGGFSFSTSPSNEYSGLISFRIDWFDLLAVQGTLKSLLQHHSSKASILQPSLWSSSHIHTCPGPWKNCLPLNWSLVPKRLGTAGLDGKPVKCHDITTCPFRLK